MCLCTGEESPVQVLLSSFVGADDVDVFRTDTATVTGQYQSPDNRPGDVDAFAREPFVVRFRAPKTGELSPSSITITTHVTSVDVSPPNQP